MNLGRKGNTQEDVMGGAMQEDIEKLRKDLDEMMSKEEKDSNKILRISEELDLLILEYYKVAGIYNR